MDTSSQDSIVNISALESEIDVEWLYSVYRFTRDSRLAGEGVSGRVHKMALVYNNSSQPALSATAFKVSMINLMNETKKLHNDVDLKVLGIDKDGSDIKGNGPFANAYKIIFNTLWYGGDLVKPFQFKNEKGVEETWEALSTVSQCRKFNSAAIKAAKTNAQYQAVFEETAKLIEAEGEYQRGTAEFNAAVIRRMNQNKPIDSDHQADQEEIDEWEKLGHEWAEKLREFASINGEKQALETATAAINKIANTVANLLAAKSGMAKAS